MAVSARRMAVEGAETRALLVEATEQLLQDEGYMAVTARQVAAKAGIKPQLVYYYFHTMDDLILAVVRKVAENRIARFHEALTSPEPLNAIWKLNSDETGALLSSEVTSLAGHREAIRAEVIRNAEEFRAMQIEAVARLLRERGIDERIYPADALVVLMTSLGRSIVTESALGLTIGHDGAKDLVERVLAQLDDRATR